ncbi:unnamed protein product [Camellia sinensis]
MGTMLGLVTWTVRMSSTSRTGRLSLKEVRLMEITSKVGSLGLPLINAAAAAADAAPTRAEDQLHITLLPMFFRENYASTTVWSLCFAERDSAWSAMKRARERQREGKRMMISEVWTRLGVL